MKRTAALIEKEKGQPIRKILIDTIEREGNITKAARALGVTQGAVSFWMKIHRLKVKAVVVPAEGESA